MSSFLFFFNDTATTEIYTLSLHDALPIYSALGRLFTVDPQSGVARAIDLGGASVSNGDGILLSGQTLYVVRNRIDRKSTRLNSSHANISYAVFCLKKKKNTK